MKKLFYRNGISGLPFNLITFDDAVTGRKMIAVRFLNDEKAIAVFDAGDIARFLVSGENPEGYRGDVFEKELGEVIEDN